MKKDSAKFKILIIFSIIFLGVFCFAKFSQAAIFFQENWDSGTPPANWPCKNPPTCPADYNNWVASDYSCENTSDVGLRSSGRTSALAHSGTYSYYQRRGANEYNSCDIYHLISGNPTKIYLRFYAYFTSNWTNFDNPAGSEGPFTHFIFTNSAYSGTGFRLNLQDINAAEYLYECYSSTVPQMHLTCENNNEGCRHATASVPCYNISSHLSQWICFEIMMDAVNDKYSLWIDGVNYVNNATQTISQDNFTKIIISGFSSTLENWQGDFYIDDIVVADSYIGPIGGGTQPDTTPPVAPTGVTVS